MKGKFWVEEVDALPTWTSTDKRRIIYYNNNYYVGGSNDWQMITIGGSDAYISAITDDTHSGDLSPSGDNVINLGSISKRYANVYAVNFQGTTTTATYADLAEKYTMDKEYPVGTVLKVSMENEYDMTIAENYWDFPAGVISDKPGFILNSNSKGIPVALVGKTPVRVVGPTFKSDYLTLNGNGTVTHTTGTQNVIAISLEDSVIEEEKLVMCLLKL